MWISNTTKQMIELSNKIINDIKIKNENSKTVLHNLEKVYSIETIRHAYDIITQKLTYDLNESIRQDSDMIIQNMNKIKNLIDVNTEINSNAMRIVNKKKVGTLEGLSREAVSKYRIPVTDEVAREVVNQPYDETEVVKKQTGGKRKKSNTRKKRNTRKKILN
jgi:superoxide dismutase